MQIKKILFFSSLFALIFYSMSCKKCYTCQNSCVQCVATYSGHVFTQILCNDSFGTAGEYAAAIANDTTLGYVCTTTTPTYNYDFCVNKPGEEDYPAYFNHGGRAPCVAK